MSNDLAPKTSVFTYQGMKLLYKEGITEQWIEKLVENTGSNRYFRNRISDQLTSGSSPTPPVDDEGSSVMIWHTFTDNTVQTLDASTDWRDRWIEVTGKLTQDISSGIPTWGTALMQLMTGGAKPDNNTTPETFDPTGSRAIAFVAGYCPGTAGQTKLDFASKYGAADVNVEIWPDPSTGDLFGQVVLPASLSDSLVIAARILYMPQFGFRTLFP